MAQPEPNFPADLVEPPSYREALATIVDRQFLKSQRHQAQHARADRLGMHPDLREFERVYVKALAKLGVPAFASEVYRPPERQAQLQADGFSKAGPGASAHQWGCGVDIIHGVHGWAISDKAWQVFGHVGHEVAKAKGVELTWGGNDGPGDRFAWDPAHWEIVNWRDVKSDFPMWKALLAEREKRLAEARARAAAKAVGKA